MAQKLKLRWTAWKLSSGGSRLKSFSDAFSVCYVLRDIAMIMVVLLSGNENIFAVPACFSRSD